MEAGGVELELECAGHKLKRREWTSGGGAHKSIMGATSP